MTQIIQQLGIDQLTRDQQIALIQELWSTIASGATTPFLSESQRKELKRRAEDDDSNPDDIVPWELVKAQAKNRLTARVYPFGSKR